MRPSLLLSSDVNCREETFRLTEKCVVPDGAAEQDGVLKDDGQPRPEGLQGQFGDVDVVDHNSSCWGKKENKINTKKDLFFLFPLCFFI